MKKLRTSAQIHAQIPVHGSEATGKLEAGIAVMTPDNATGKSTTQFRYDVYFLTLF